MIKITSVFTVYFLCRNRYDRREAVMIVGVKVSKEVLNGEALRPAVPAVPVRALWPHALDL